LCLWFNIIFGFISVFISIYVSWIYSDWTWFSRSGSILIIYGVILSARPIIRMGVMGLLKYYSTIDCGSASPTPQDIEDERQEYLDVKANKFGVFMAIAGTIVWAYGDLIERFFS